MHHNVSVHVMGSSVLCDVTPDAMTSNVYHDVTEDVPWRQMYIMVHIMVIQVHYDGNHDVMTLTMTSRRQKCASWRRGRRMSSSMIYLVKISVFESVTLWVISLLDESQVCWLPRFVCVSVCLSVCLSVRTHKSKTIDRIDLNILHTVGSGGSSILLEGDPDPDPDRDSMTSFPVFGLSAISRELFIVETSGYQNWIPHWILDQIGWVRSPSVMIDFSLWRHIYPLLFVGTWKSNIS